MKAKDRTDAALPVSPSLPAEPPASWIEKDPTVCGGDARIRGTRIPVWGIVEWRALGLSDAEILKHHPDLTPADLDAASAYHREHEEPINLDHFESEFFRRAIRRNVQEYVDHFGERLVAIYVMGSVHRNEAVPGVSDLDIYAVIADAFSETDQEWWRQEIQGSWNGSLVAAVE